MLTTTLTTNARVDTIAPYQSKRFFLRWPLRYSPMVWVGSGIRDSTAIFTSISAATMSLISFLSAMSILFSPLKPKVRQARRNHRACPHKIAETVVILELELDGIIVKREGSVGIGM